MKKLILKLTVSLLVIGTFVGVSTDVHASTTARPGQNSDCDGIFPVDQLLCEAFGDSDVAGLASCEPPTRVTDGVAGCYDTNGDCVGDTYYTVRIVESYCTTWGGTRTKCSPVEYTAAGTCPNV